MIDRDMACAVCTRALNAVDDDGTNTFEHPVVPDEDHDPQPVPAWHLDQVYRRWHLCSIGQPVWMYRTPPVEVIAVGGNRPATQTYSTRWQVCCTCAHLINQNDAAALTRRSITAIGWHPNALSAHILARLLRGTVDLPAPLDDSERRRLEADGLDLARLYWVDLQFTALVAEVLDDLPETRITDRIVPTGGGLLAWSTPVDQRHRIAAASWTPHPDGWQMILYPSLGLDLHRSFYSPDDRGTSFAEGRDCFIIWFDEILRCASGLNRLAIIFTGRVGPIPIPTSTGPICDARHVSVVSQKPSRRCLVLDTGTRSRIQEGTNNDFDEAGNGFAGRKGRGRDRGGVRYRRGDRGDAGDLRRASVLRRAER